MLKVFHVHIFIEEGGRKMITPVGFLFLGIVGGVTGGLILGVVRERKGKNKKYIFWGPKLEK